MVSFQSDPIGCQTAMIRYKETWACPIDQSPFAIQSRGKFLAFNRTEILFLKNIRQ